MPPFFVGGILNIFLGMGRDVGEVCIFADGGGWAAAFQAFICWR